MSQILNLSQVKKTLSTMFQMNQKILFQDFWNLGQKTGFQQKIVLNIPGFRKIWQRLILILAKKFLMLKRQDR